MLRPMRAVTIADGALSVESGPTPTRVPSEILVAVRAAGINGADILQRKGAYPAPAGCARGHPGARAGRRGRRAAGPAPSASRRATA